MSKLVGRVQWFDQKKGFGFIESHGKQYFLHYSEIDTDGFKTVNEGQKVRFTSAPGDKGERATCVTVSSE
jgi:cold shock protein